MCKTLNLQWDLSSVQGCLRTGPRKGEPLQFARDAISLTPSDFYKHAPHYKDPIAQGIHCEISCVISGDRETFRGIAYMTEESDVLCLAFGLGGRLTVILQSECAAWVRTNIKEHGLYQNQ